MSQESSGESRGDRILVVDDSAPTLEILRRNLTASDYVVFTADSVEGAVDILEKTPIDLVITDMKMPQQTGVHLIRHVRENFRDTAVMMITGYASVQGAVEAMHLGAEDYLAKPFTDEELLATVQKTLDRSRRRRGHPESQTEIEASIPAGMVGSSPAMRRVYHAIEKAAAAAATVLVTGESGTGKELIARAVHYRSTRAAAPFVPVNCGGIPESLMESALFGHRKGAFTHAHDTRAGFFQTADGGTIFLDEISEMSTTMQVKLLRVLQDREVYMVGSTKPQSVDIRIVAATNRELLSLVEKGAFREDLYYRLNVIPIQAPPLRDRGDDILLLIDHFVSRFSASLGRNPPRVSERAMAALQGYHWPGNVRELENVIQRLVVMCETDEVDVTDLPTLMRFSALRGERAGKTLREVESEHIRYVLDECGNNKSKAARILGIDRKTLREKLRTHDIPDDDGLNR